MKYTMRVYKESAKHPSYLEARFGKGKTGNSFLFEGHRWAYEHTSFDDDGDYDLLYRFDDKPYPEDVSVTVASDDMTLRDYFAAKAMQAMISNPSIIDNDSDGAVNYAASAAYKFADAMLRVREAS
ncbi:hypothetical protein ACSLNB_22565 [Citrobacter portucalensis]|uniref:hypothetical protein n=1 Tax=Citrobacter portucalensis TaxID=1639133 RepID=UPI003EE34E08